MGKRPAGVDRLPDGARSRSTQVVCTGSLVETGGRHIETIGGAHGILPQANSDSRQTHRNRVQTNRNNLPAFVTKPGILVADLETFASEPETRDSARGGLRLGENGGPAAQAAPLRRSFRDAGTRLLAATSHAGLRKAARGSGDGPRLRSHEAPNGCLP